MVIHFTNSHFPVQCDMCKRWKSDGKWVVDPPSDYQRSLASHGRCDPCMIKSLREEGFSEEHIAGIIKELHEP